jgi:Rps23 Pro-64 3,4-dihydroxylase Tpa1-like proline 4-hydroxylase
MNLKYEIFYRPIAHIIIDNFFTEDQLKKTFYCIDNLEELMNYGKVVDKENSVTETNFKFKKVKNLWVYELIQDSNNVNEMAKEFINLIENKMWSNEMRNLYLECTDSLFQYYHEVNESQILLSKYEKGNFYDWHHDLAISVTGNIWLSRDNVEGGNLILVNNKTESKEIKFRNNACILFPGRCAHMVSEVLNDSKRFSIQYFTNVKNIF